MHPAHVVLLLVIILVIDEYGIPAIETERQPPIPLTETA